MDVITLQIYFILWSPVPLSLFVKEGWGGWGGGRLSFLNFPKKGEGLKSSR